jgi:hypothetical protein
MPPVHFKRIQKQNNTIVFGVYVCLIPIATSTVAILGNKQEYITYL